MRMYWFLFVLVIFVNLSFNGFSEHTLEINKKKVSVSASAPPAVVVGTVFCDTCFQQDLSKTTHFISGATVAVECRDEKTRKASFRREVKTNKKGKFRVNLPFSVAKHVKRIESCCVNLMRSSEPFCSVASSATSSVLHFKSNNNRGTPIFSAGFFTFKPLQQPTFCNQKQLQIASLQSLLPPVLPSPVLPPPVAVAGDTKVNPQLLFPPLLPPNPLTPPPLIPNPLQPPAPVIPNPFQPPPAPIIPNPFQPAPAPIIPNPFQPPPPTIIPNPFRPLPPIPFVTPSPPPPPPSLFPPFLPPFPPFPGIPSGPPREETSLTSKLESP